MNAKRPQIKDFFNQSTDITDVQKAYTNNKELFNYIQALDTYIDENESRHGMAETVLNEIENAMERWHHASDEDVETLQKI